jgi:hypothetical protein
VCAFVDGSAGGVLWWWLFVSSLVLFGGGCGYEFAVESFDGTYIFVGTVVYVDFDTRIGWLVETWKGLTRRSSRSRASKLDSDALWDELSTRGLRAFTLCIPPEPKVKSNQFMTNDVVTRFNIRRDLACPGVFLSNESVTTPSSCFGVICTLVDLEELEVVDFLIWTVHAGHVGQYWSLVAGEVVGPLELDVRASTSWCYECRSNGIFSTCYLCCCRIENWSYATSVLLGESIDDSLYSWIGWINHRRIAWIPVVG